MVDKKEQALISIANELHQLNRHFTTLLKTLEESNKTLAQFDVAFGKKQGEN